MGENDNDVDPLFKRKKRTNNIARKRKRPRLHSSDWKDANDSEISVFPNSKSRLKQANPKPNHAWKRVEYPVAQNNPSNLPPHPATAERRDTGGERTKNAPTAKAKSSFGPLGAPTNLRVSVRVDYQPDVCKDFKETGYCGFGDACKFLHDRSDYKAGWQLEKDWVAKQQRRQDRIMRGEDPDEEEDTKKDDSEFDEDGLPFACYICREKFNRPVETLCKHYFCEACILKRMRTDSTCPVCKAQLRGTLNTAHKLADKISRAVN